MDLQPVLENELVKIRPLTLSDIEALFEAANDPKIWEQHPCKRNERAEFEKFFAESIASKGALAIIDVKTNVIIGSSRYKLAKGFDMGIEIGWTFLTPNYWGGEYNKMVKALMIAHAFNYVEYVALYIDKKNIRSQKAAIKIGAILVDSKHNYIIPNKSTNHLRFIIKK